MPGSATAPGPGRSAAPSTSELKVSGMQKMLTSVAGFAGPPVVSGPDGDPCSTMVRAVSVFVKAPGVRWPQLVNPVTLVQSPFEVQGMGRHGAPLHAGQGVPILQEHAAPDA